MNMKSENPKPHKHVTSHVFDKWAVLISLLCVVHCLILPFLILIIPFLGFLANEHWVHQVLILIAAPISAIALWRNDGWRNPLNFALAFIGLLLLALTAFVPQLFVYEMPLSVTGALLIAYVHIRNALTPNCGTECKLSH
jgi:MerC mercury resistance protein